MKSPTLILIKISAATGGIGTRRLLRKAVYFLNNIRYSVILR